MGESVIVVRTLVWVEAGAGGQEKGFICDFATAAGKTGQVLGWTKDRSRAARLDPAGAERVARYYQDRSAGGDLTFEPAEVPAPAAAG